MLRIVSLVFLFYCWHLVYAQETYLVGVENHDYYPHYGMTKEYEYHGFAREMLDNFAAAQGIRLEYKPLPVGRLFRELVDGSVDFKYPDHPAWSKTLKEKVNITYSLPVVAYIDGILIRPYQGTVQVEQIKQLATILGFTLLPFWQNRVETGLVQRIDVKHYDSLLLMALIGHRLEGIYANIDVGLYRLQQINAGKSHVPVPEQLKADKQVLLFVPELPHDRSYYHLSTLKHPALITAFNRYLGEQAIQINVL